MNNDELVKTGDYPDGLTFFHATYNCEKRVWENCEGIEDKLRAFLDGPGIVGACHRWQYGVDSPRDNDILAYYFGHFPPTDFEIFTIGSSPEAAHRILARHVWPKEKAPEGTAIPAEADIENEAIGG